MEMKSVDCDGHTIKVEVGPTGDGRLVVSFDWNDTFLFAHTLDVRQAALISGAIQEYLKGSEAAVPVPVVPERPEGTVLEALRAARDTFRHYGHLHRAKHTADGLKKAETNEVMARRMDAAVGLHLNQLELVRHLKDLVGKARDTLARVA